MSSTAAWLGIGAVVITATAGDVLQARAMKEIGDLGVIRRSRGWLQVVRQVVSNPRFMLGLLFMALAFFSLLITLSWGDVSVVGPASASLTFIANAFAARIFLKERVDHRRWLAAAFVAGGVALLAR
ncbi:MAG: EamA family transporter [Candidatus Korobacteraceae bacterium]